MKVYGLGLLGRFLEFRFRWFEGLSLGFSGFKGFMV